MPGSFTTGCKSPSATSSAGWTNPNNVFASDDVRATITRTTAGETAYFRAYGFNFGVPADAFNIRHEWQFEATVSAAPSYSYWYLGNVLAGTPQSVSSFGVTVPITPAVEAYAASMGGPNTDWGGVDVDANGTKDRDWTPADVNATNFGISGA